MTFNCLRPRAIAACVVFAAFSSQAYAGCATGHLKDYDASTYSGWLEAQVSLYGVPDKNGTLPKPKVYPAQLLFERPDRFRLVLRPGAKNEYRAVASGGIVNWYDAGTGMSGKAKTEEVTDPLALALLDSVGEINRYAPATEIKLGDAKLCSAQLLPRAWNTGVKTGNVWFTLEGVPTGFSFDFQDNSRVFIAVLKSEKNPKTSPDDFKL